MFYSQLLLSRKGALGVVWLAAHCHKMLKKEQVQQTNISASVDRILIDEAQTFTYRILAFLLLGVVRIYSKKVEYLLKDCLEIMNKLNGVETPRSKSRSARYLPSNYQAIARPARFELDEFDLELPENQDLGSGNLRSHKKAKISGGRGRQKESYTRGSSTDKMPATPASSYTTPLKDILSPHAAHMDVFASASSVSVSVSDTPNKNRLFLEEDRLEPMDLDEETHREASHEDLSTYSQDLTANASHNSKERSFEIARGFVFNADDECLEPLLLDDEENELITNGKSYGENERSNLQSPMEVEDIGSPSLQRMDLESSLGIPEKSVSTSDHCHVLEQNLKVMETPVVELPEAGNVTEEVSVIKTPATTERPKTSKKGKRRSWIDQSSVVSNMEYASWLEDASNIVRPRNVAPRTWLGAWRARKLSGMPQSVLEPIIPFPSESVGIIKTRRATEPPMEASANDQTAPVIIIQSGEIGETNAPLYDFVSHSLEDEEENDSVSLNSGKDVFSARTRIIGDYLSRKFLEKKKRKSGDEALNMSQLLQGKTKKASARLFYEILVLKSHDYIDVKQDIAYHDILLRERRHS